MGSMLPYIYIAYMDPMGNNLPLLTGWWYTYPSEKNMSQWEGLSHILWKIQKGSKPPTS